MKKVILILLLALINLYPQKNTGVLITYGDFMNDEIRVGVLDIALGEINDLGFNKSYLPFIFQEKVFFNSDRFMWSVNWNGKELKQENKGFRGSPSPDGMLLAYYTSTGIEVVDAQLKRVKFLEVEFTPDVQITWLPSSEGLTFSREGQTFVYNFRQDSIYQIGQSIFQPVWHPKSDKFIYTNLSQNNIYSIKMGKGANTSRNDLYVTGSNAEAFAPQWSASGKYIAFYSIKKIPELAEELDMIHAEIVVVNSENLKVISTFKNAAYTDGVYPQFSFSPDERYIYYTGATKFGTGNICLGNLQTGEIKTVDTEEYLDIRFPVAVFINN
ncbi:MAG: PD40 domain-containing protein [Ignavibacteriaceae bacterium]|nr:PD40 domain-containing protein [Ignavibacteriaceae bacterium]